MTRRLIPSLLFASVVASTVVVAWAAKPVSLSTDTISEWPQWRGPQRDGHSPATGLMDDWTKQKPRLLWTAEGIGNGYASVSLGHSMLYTTGNLPEGQGVVAVKADDGKLAWTTILTDGVPKHGYEGSRCMPTIDGDRLYVVTSDGQVACLDAFSGDVVWKRNFDTWGGRMMSIWGFTECPLVDGDKVIVTPGGPEAVLVALNKKNGDEIWRTAMPEIGRNGKDGAAYSSVVISSGAGVKQYVQLVGRGVIGVRASDGKFLWGYNAIANDTANIPTPIVDGDYVFCSTGYQTGAALLQLKRDGDGVVAEEVYFLPSSELQNHHGQLILVDGYIYGGHGHNEGFPICVDMKTGDVVWGGAKNRGPGRKSAAVTYADGNLIFRYQSGEVALIEATPEKYKLKGYFTPEFVQDPCWAHPAVADGRLYLREQNKLMCYDIRK